MTERAIWHDVECGGYVADLELWDELARDSGGRVLDVGAGTGRVSLRLASAGHEVTALDIDDVLLRVLEARAAGAGLEVETVVADAAGFEVEGEFGLVAVPMQTIQLLPDARARAGFFASARRAVADGGLVALAIADGLEGFDEVFELPPPDVGVQDGWRYYSQPMAVRETPGGARIERLRHAVGPHGERTTEENVVVLATLTAGQLEAEGAAAGLAPEPSRHVGPTAEHVGSEVVLLRG